MQMHSQSYYEKLFSGRKKAPWSYILFIHVIFVFSNRKEKKKIKIQTITSSMGEHTNGFALQLFRYSILKPIIWHF